jgi:hypothetical protein
MAVSQTGDLNRNEQRLVAKTDQPGTDHLQYIWVLECPNADIATERMGPISIFGYAQCAKAAGPASTSTKYRHAPRPRRREAPGRRDRQRR